MKKTAAFFAAVILSAFLLPPLVTAITKNTDNPDTADISNGDAITAGSFSQPFKLTVYNTKTANVEQTELEEYLVGVLAAEMPPTYHTEALKAQAVAARSFILSKAADCMEGASAAEHHGAMVCTDYKHCKAQQNINDAKSKWDARFADDYETKIRQAVNQTGGEYMVYDNKVVKAYFYAISSGKTESCADIWGKDIPYLKSVSSREDIGCDGFEAMSTYPKDLFLQKLRTISNAEQNDISVGDTKRSQGGSVLEISIGGNIFSGEEIRETFNLRSANFEIITEGDKITFRTKGYGHGVGMSQNGANVLALSGKSYTEILKHYYSGVDMVNLYKKA